MISFTSLFAKPSSIDYVLTCRSANIKFFNFSRISPLDTSAALRAGFSLYREIDDMESATSDLERAISLDPIHSGPRQVLEEISKFVGREA